MKTITWIDVETTGLSAQRNSLLEIACLVTDGDLNVLDESGYQAVVHHTYGQAQTAFAEANGYVQHMHAKTGLWGRLTSGTALSLIDTQLHRYVRQFSEAKTSPVGGNSVRLDMNFMDANLPLVAGHLDYHMIDVSTVSNLASIWYGEPWFEKASDHTAMTDIRESIKELKHYRKAAFK